MHIPYPERCRWIEERMEGAQPEIDQEHVLKRILAAEGIESFIHTRYVGTKRFSLEGVGALIPLIDSVLETAAERGFEHVLIGMSHRGRLNVMHNIIGVEASKIFADFEDVDPKSTLGGGDVKYHKGATGAYKTKSGKELIVRVASNPSHLEAVNPVVMGRTRAYQERIGDEEKTKVLAILIHGDAAFAGQGIAAETLNFFDLRGFRVGGVVNIIANNLIGFTAVPRSLHSSHYATSVALRLPIPVFHVNGEEPDAVWRTGQLAMNYRAEFKSEVVIDLIGHRKFGHSEIDDPTITSPELYHRLEDLDPLYVRYGKQMGLSDEQIEERKEQLYEKLSTELEQGRQMTQKPQLYKFPNHWEGFVGGLYDESLEVDTAVPQEELEDIAETLTTFPEGFTVHPKIGKGYQQRLEMAQGKRNIDWGAAEAFAFGSLLKMGIPVRIAGQDSRRGTFSHRQAALYDYKTSEEFLPLRVIADKANTTFDAYDSQLSEAAALGFEYGFSRDYPEALVCWEAQFGDFANGAQIIIDQFLSAAEDKWGLLSGVVMLLPHGYEGQGPEHSSARLERYLQLCGEDNMQVVQPSSAAQFFHLLRRQVLRKWRKPLIVMTPKSMLRLPAATSSIDQLTSGRYFNVISDSSVENAERVLICSGKIYYELVKERKSRELEDKVAIVRLEQYYPFPAKELTAALDEHPNATHLAWVQEEPANMGALFFVKPEIERSSRGRVVKTVRRSESASPATGSPKSHAMEQQALYNLAFASFS